jgi:surface antigen
MKKVKKFRFFLAMLVIIIGCISQFNNVFAADAAIGDDYPEKWKNRPLGDTYDDWGMSTRYCTSFVANRLSKTNKFDIPRGYDWNANQWGNNARKLGYKVDMVPKRGSVAYWYSGYHVAWVAAVNGDNVLIEEYNYGYKGKYNSRWIKKNSVDGYIHFKDIASTPKSQAINKYITITKDGQNFFGNIDCTSKKSKTSRGRIYYVKIAYKLTNGQLLYSVYEDEKCKTWIGYLKQGSSEYTQIQSFNKKQVVLTNNSTALWKNLNFQGRLGTSVSGNAYTVNRVFYNLTNNAYYYELYRGTTFCGYVNSAAVKDILKTSIKKYVTLTEDGQNIYGNYEQTNIRKKTERGRIYYSSFSYDLGNGTILHSIYTDETMSEWLGYVKESLFEYTAIQSFNKKQVVLTNNSTTLWKNLNYQGRLGTSVSGDAYTVNRVFYNLTNNAYYYELYRGTTFCGYVNSAAVKDILKTSIKKYVTLTEDGQNIYGNYEQTNIRKKTERGRIYYSSFSYDLRNGTILHSIYTDETMSEWLGYVKESLFEYTAIQSFNKKQVVLTNNSTTLWKNLNYQGRLGTSVSGDAYTVNRVFYNLTNNAYYYELYRGTTFCGYVNSAAVKDILKTSIKKYVTLTEDGQNIYGNYEQTNIRKKTERGRIYYSSFSYDLRNGTILHSIYTDETMSEWLGYVKESLFEYTAIQSFNKKQVVLTNNSTTLWKNLNYQGRLGTSVSGDAYTVNRVFYNLTNNAYYYELYRGTTFCGYVNSAAVKDILKTSIKKYVTPIEDGQNIYGNYEQTNIRGKTERGRNYYSSFSYDLGNGTILHSIYTDETMSEWLGYVKENTIQIMQEDSLDSTSLSDTAIQNESGNTDNMVPAFSEKVEKESEDSLEEKKAVTTNSIEESNSQDRIPTSDTNSASERTENSH